MTKKQHLLFHLPITQSLPMVITGASCDTLSPARRHFASTGKSPLVRHSIHFFPVFFLWKSCHSCLELNLCPAKEGFQQVAQPFTLPQHLKHPNTLSLTTVFTVLTVFTAAAGLLKALPAFFWKASFSKSSRVATSPVPAVDDTGCIAVWFATTGGPGKASAVAGVLAKGNTVAVPALFCSGSNWSETCPSRVRVLGINSVSAPVHEVFQFLHQAITPQRRGRSTFDQVLQISWGLTLQQGTCGPQRNLWVEGSQTQGRHAGFLISIALLDPIPFQASGTGRIQLQRCHSSSHLCVGKALDKVICQTVDAPRARQWMPVHSHMHMKKHCYGCLLGVRLQPLDP